MAVVLVVLGILSTVGIAVYGRYSASAHDAQATDLLAGIAQGEQSWYLTHHAYVAVPDAAATDTEHTLSAGSARTLLYHIAPGTGDTRTQYLTGDAAPSAFGQLSLAAGSTSNGTALLALATVSATGKCAGALVAPAETGIKDIGPQILDPAPADSRGITCTADAVLAAYSPTQP